MATIADRILEAIRFKPMDDDQLARRLGVSQRQSINQTARRLEAQGLLRRYVGTDGKIVNALPEAPTEADTNVTVPEAVPPRTPVQVAGPISEDEVKRAVRDHLVVQGFEVRVAWGRVPGIDIEATHPDGRRWVIEAKAEKGVTGAQQHNYFVGALGELVQRMDDPTARYALALPDNRQYRGLVTRLPAYARDRLALAVFWVSREGDSLTVAVEE